MSETDDLAGRFEQHRPRLRAVAYRMLGTTADADDAVQNAWLRLAGADAQAVDNLGGWLTTVVARECLKILRSRRTHQEQPWDEAADEIGTIAEADEPEARTLLADAVGPALLIVLDALAPAERIAFVLHDVFAMPFDEIAPILERSPVATRQVASRARRRVREAAPPLRADLARQRRVVDAFLVALRAGDFAGLLDVLDPDVTLHDTSHRPELPAPLRGAEQVAAHAAGFSWGAAFARPALVDGTVGVAIASGAQLVGVLAFAYHQEKISHIEVIDQPDGHGVTLAGVDGRAQRHGTS